MLDSGCTNHMTGEKDMFTSFQPSHDQSGNIVFGDNGKGEVLGLGKIAISNDNSISNILLVKWVIIVSLRIRVWKSIEGRIPLLHLRVI